MARFKTKAEYAAEQTVTKPRQGRVAQPTIASKVPDFSTQTQPKVVAVHKPRTKPAPAGYATGKAINTAAVAVASTVAGTVAGTASFIGTRLWSFAKGVVGADPR